MKPSDNLLTGNFILHVKDSYVEIPAENRKKKFSIKFLVQTTLISFILTFREDNY